MASKLELTSTTARERKLLRAARRVMRSIGEHIQYGDQEHIPVYAGIADLHSALQSYRRRAAPPTEGRASLWKNLKKFKIELDESRSSVRELRAALLRARSQLNIIAMCNREPFCPLCREGARIAFSETGKVGGAALAEKETGGSE